MHSSKFIRLQNIDSTVIRVRPANRAHLGDFIRLTRYNSSLWAYLAFISINRTLLFTIGNAVEALVKL
jgi:hypothetical protein